MAFGFTAKINQHKCWISRRGSWRSHQTLIPGNTMVVLLVLLRLKTRRLDQWFSTDLTTQVTMGNAWKHFWCHTSRGRVWGFTGTKWIDTTDALNFLWCPRQLPQQRIAQSKNVTRTEVENPWAGLKQSSQCWDSLCEHYPTFRSLWLEYQ